MLQIVFFIATLPTPMSDDSEFTLEEAIKRTHQAPERFCPCTGLDLSTSSGKFSSNHLALPRQSSFSYSIRCCLITCSKCSICSVLTVLGVHFRLGSEVPEVAFSFSRLAARHLRRKLDSCASV